MLLLVAATPAPIGEASALTKWHIVEPVALSGSWRSSARLISSLALEGTAAFLSRGAAVSAATGSGEAQVTVEAEQVAAGEGVAAAEVEGTASGISRSHPLIGKRKGIRWCGSITACRCCNPY